MGKEVIRDPNSAQPIGPYSQAIEVNNLIFTSGQIPLEPVSGQVVSDDFSEFGQFNC